MEIGVMAYIPIILLGVLTKYGRVVVFSLVFYGALLQAILGTALKWYFSFTILRDLNMKILKQMQLRRLVNQL
jgi:hypothetical protein